MQIKCLQENDRHRHDRIRIFPYIAFLSLPSPSSPPLPFPFIVFPLLPSNPFPLLLPITLTPSPCSFSSPFLLFLSFPFSLPYPLLSFSSSSHRSSFLFSLLSSTALPSSFLSFSYTPSLSSTLFFPPSFLIPSLSFRISLAFCPTGDMIDLSINMACLR